VVGPGAVLGSFPALEETRPHKVTALAPSEVIMVHHYNMHESLNNHTVHFEDAVNPTDHMLAGARVGTVPSPTTSRRLLPQAPADRIRKPNPRY
jgi:hypothetical protein